MLPLLMQVMDGFKGLHGGISKTAEARELFSRQGTELLTFLSLGTDGLRAMGDEAQRLGLVFNKADLTAVKEFKAEMRELRLEEEALNIEIGRRGLGVSHMFDLGKIGFIEALKASGGNFTAFFALWGAQMDMAEARIKNLAKATAAMENGPGLAHPEPKANAEGKPKAESDFRALSKLLDQVTAKSAGLTSEEAKAAQEIVHLQNELDKAADAFIKVQQEGTITGEALEREAGRMAALPAAIERLQGQLATGIEDKRRTALEETTRDLTSRLESEQEQTFASRQRAFAREMDGSRTRLGASKMRSQRRTSLSWKRSNRPAWRRSGASGAMHTVRSWWTCSSTWRRSCRRA